MDESRRMRRLIEIARVIRSKNAGPFELTFDIMFETLEVYRRVRDSGVINKQMISSLYNTPPEDVHLVNYDAAYAIKFTIPRPTFQGEIEDSDLMGGQQYGPLVDLEVPD